MIIGLGTMVGTRSTCTPASTSADRRLVSTIVGGKEEKGLTRKRTTVVFMAILRRKAYKLPHPLELHLDLLLLLLKLALSLLQLVAFPNGDCRRRRLFLLPLLLFLPLLLRPRRAPLRKEPRRRYARRHRWKEVRPSTLSPFELPELSSADSHQALRRARSAEEGRGRCVP